MVMIVSIKKCPECNRLFDLMDEDDANEWHYGHDCEPEFDPDHWNNSAQTMHRLA